MSRLKGDTNEQPAWRAWANEIIAEEVRYFTDANGEIDRIGLRASVLHSMGRIGGHLYRQAVADSLQNMIRELINKNIAQGHGSYAIADREAKRIRRVAAFHRAKVTVPLGGNVWATKTRLSCTLADARLMASYRHQRSQHERRDERWWQAVINRMERQHRTEDEPISVVIKRVA